MGKVNTRVKKYKTANIKAKTAIKKHTKPRNTFHKCKSAKRVLKLKQYLQKLKIQEQDMQNLIIQLQQIKSSDATNIEIKINIIYKS